MFKLEIIAKLNAAGLNNTVNLLGQDGRNYTLYYKMSILGFSLSWTPVKFVTNFPS